MARDRRPLGPEEEQLWSAVKKTVSPLHPERPKPAPVPAAIAEEPRPPRATAPPPQTPVRPAPPVSRPQEPPLHGLGRRDRQKVVRGSTPIDGRLDLHGLRQDEAHARLKGFLARAQASGWKLVLVITGKGKSGGDFESLHGYERGVLRRIVPLWLGLPEFRAYVLGFEEAHLAHGGSGAIYIRIRKKR